jgi:hypothetical protein
MSSKSSRGPTHANDVQTIPAMQKVPQSRPPVGKPAIAPASKFSEAAQPANQPTPQK